MASLQTTRPVLAATRPKTLSLLIPLALSVFQTVQADTTQQLEEVVVRASSEPQDSYLSTKTRAAKTLQDPHDLPQAITTITRTLIEEQDASSLREAMRNVSSVSFNAAEGGRAGDNMNLRGFYTFGDMYLDGVRDTAQYNRELFNLEQLEVLRGAAAMLFGRGQAGGVINQVSKSPKLKEANKVSAAIGTDGYSQATADFNHILGEMTALRINLMNRDDQGWRQNPVTGDRPEIHRLGFAPSVAWGLGTEQTFTLSHFYLKTNDNPDYGIPFDATTKRVSGKYAATDYWGTANTFDRSETNISTAQHQWKIDVDSQLSTKIRAANYKRAYWAAAPGNETNFATGGSAKTRKFDTDNLVVQSDYSTSFKFAGMHHELITGIEYLQEKSKRWSLANVGNASPAFYDENIVGFVNGNTGALFDTRPANQFTSDTYSVYLQDTIEFVPNWKLTAGVRRDEMDSRYTAVTGVQTAGKITSTSTSDYAGKFGENSYRLGLSWHPEADTHYYLSWSDAFSPTADLYQLAGSQYPAERSQVREIGAKWLLFDGDLALRTALYQADKEWERNNDLESTAAILTRQRQTTGIEFELAGRINARWEVFSGISLMNPIVKEVAPGANSNFTDQIARNSPRETFNLWSTYKLEHGWKLGGGAEYKSVRYVYSPAAAGTASFEDTARIAPAYVRWDAMVAFEQPKYTVKLNVQNLSNQVYYDALYDNGGFAVPGQGRRFILSLETSL